MTLRTEPRLSTALATPPLPAVKPPVANAIVPKPLNVALEAGITEGATPVAATDLFEARALATPAGFLSTAEKADVAHLNARRKRLGLSGTCARTPTSPWMARSWAKHMATTGTLAHRKNLGAAATKYVGRKWSSVGENVGVGQSEKQLWGAWVKSKPHRANLDNRHYDSVGVGAYRDAKGNLWMVQVFADFRGR